MIPRCSAQPSQRGLLCVSVCMLMLRFPLCGQALMTQSRVAVPDVTKRPMRLAQDILEEHGFTQIRVSTLEDTAAAGTVLRQLPPAHTPVPRGSPVSLLVSNGASRGPFEMPDLFGKTIPEAQQILKSQKIAIREAGTQPSPQPPGTIIAQQPSAGASLPPDHIANVTLAAAMPREVQVPRVIGMQQYKAMQQLVSARLSTGTAYSRPDNAAAGVVIAQSPGPGDLVALLTPVNITISSGPPSLLQIRFSFLISSARTCRLQNRY
jgi:beta-lactam-binding protein with PASTA domain